MSPCCRSLFSSPTLTVNYYPGGKDEIVYIFGSIGQNRDIRKARPSRDEFVGFASGGGARHVVVIKDNLRSWFTNADISHTWQFIASVVRGIVQPARISTLGLSMGGFAALKYSSLLGADTAIGFSPQFSIDPAVVKDRRWQRFMENVDLSNQATIGLHDIGPGTYWALFGGQATRDDRHAHKFLAFPQINVLQSEDGYHNFPSLMKSKGLLGPLIDHLLEQRELTTLSEYGLQPLQIQKKNR